MKPPASFPRPPICLRCQVRQQTRQDLRALYIGDVPSNIRRSSSYTKSAPSPGYYPPPSQLTKPAFAHLTNRSVIRLQGPDVVAFLNGLLPAKLQTLAGDGGSNAPVFTAFLSAKGRILYEAFIYPPPDSSSDGPWHIDVDTASQAALFSHLKKHKLRSKFKIEKVSGDELGVFYVWPEQQNQDLIKVELGGQDPRPFMGMRFLSNPSKSSPTVSTLMSVATDLSLDKYNIHRLLTGHAEGPKELIPASALPQESNVDFDGGIDFHKGCYLGQELTIRTHHTGIVRKRILPCQVYSKEEQPPREQTVPLYDAAAAVHQPPAEANISKRHAKGRSGRSTGKWLGGVGNIGLALCRLETMTDIQLTAEGTNFDPEGEFSVIWEEGEAGSDGKATIREVTVKPFVPQWLRDNIQAGIRARSDRSKKRRQDEDDEDEDVD